MCVWGVGVCGGKNWGLARVPGGGLGGGPLSDGAGVKMEAGVRGVCEIGGSMKGGDEKGDR